MSGSGPGAPRSRAEIRSAKVIPRLGLDGSRFAVKALRLFPEVPPDH
jgi:hypothetical protein